MKALALTCLAIGLLSACVRTVGRCDRVRAGLASPRPDGRCPTVHYRRDDAERPVPEPCQSGKDWRRGGRLLRSAMGGHVDCDCRTGGNVRCRFDRGVGASQWQGHRLRGKRIASTVV